MTVAELAKVVYSLRSGSGNQEASEGEHDATDADAPVGNTATAEGTLRLKPIGPPSAPVDSITRGTQVGKCR